MSLNWRLGDIDGWETVCQVEHNGTKTMSPVTESLIWASLVCGYQRITDKNWEDVAVRIQFYEQLFGAMRGPDDLRITPAQVKQHIGLWTNANDTTYKNFVKRMGEHFKSEALRDAEEIL